jgi:hypothetical protein
MGSASLKPLLLNDASKLFDEPERKDEFVVARHFVEVVSDKRKKEPYLVENVLVVKVVRRFETRDEAWEFAYGLAGWAGAEQAQQGRKQDSYRGVRRRSRMP